MADSTPITRPGAPGDAPEAASRPTAAGTGVLDDETRALDDEDAADIADITADQAAPAPGSPAPPDPRAGAAALKDLLRPVRAYLWAGSLLSGLSAVCALAPYAGVIHLGRILLDAHAAGRAPQADQVQDAVGLILGGLGGRLLLYFVALAITHIADLRLSAELRRRIVQTLARAPLSWFSESSSGRVRKAVQNDAHDLHYLVAHQYVEYTSAIVMPLAALVYALVIDWRLGLLAVATLPIYIVIQVWSMRGMGDLTKRVDAMMATVSARIVELIAGIAVVKAFGRAGRAHERYTLAAVGLAEYYRNWCAPVLRSNALATSVIAPAVILLVNLAGGAAMIGAGRVGPLQVLATSLIALLLPTAIDTLTWSTWTNQLAGAAALRIQEILSTEALPETTSPRRPEGHEVRFEEVSFSYGTTRALDAVSLVLAPGTVTALVGASGSGKSTLATLLARFNDPDQGRITLGGADLRDIPTAELYTHVAFVLQDAQLLEASLADNIRLARPDAGLEQVRDAARAAQIDEVIMALPQGYDTILGRQTALSGGQAQRVAIARAILADAPVLILDEATAFADPESEAAIQDALSRLVRGRTVLVIAHRPAALVNADQVAVLEGGRLAALGTHAELLANPGYAALWEASAPSQPAEPSQAAQPTPSAAAQSPAAVVGAPGAPPAVSLAPGSPGDDDAPHSQERHRQEGAVMIRAVVSMMSPQGRRHVRHMVVLSCVAGAAQGVAALLLLPVVDALVLGRSPWGWIGLLAALALLAAVLQYWLAMASYEAAFDIMRHLNVALGDKLIRLPLGWFDTPRQGELSQLAGKGVMDLGSSIAHMLPQALLAASQCLAMVLGSWLIDWRLGVALTLAAPLFALAVLGSRRIGDAADARSHAAQVEVNDRVIEFARAQGALRSCGRAGAYAPLERALKAQSRSAVSQFWISVPALGLAGAALQAVLAVLVLLVAGLVVGGQVGAYQAVALIGIGLRFVQPLDQVVSMSFGVRPAQAQGNRLRRVLEAEELTEPEASASTTSPGQVVLDDVHFSYGAEPVLRGVSLRAEPGTFTALVGPSGSGKTTITRLIARFYDVDRGSVRIDGADVRELTTADLMDRLSMVFQDVYLFDDTLEANIRVGRHDATEEEVREAARTAGVEEIVRRLPQGWQTPVGEAGSRLSGGERQRVAIARALLKRAPIVLLDEATSALDPANEARVVRAMEVLARHSTVIAIAHKLTTVRRADQIIALGQDGRVEQVGTHEELMAGGGRYARYWRERERAATWSLSSRG